MESRNILWYFGSLLVLDRWCFPDSPWCEDLLFDDPSPFPVDNLMITSFSHGYLLRSVKKMLQMSVNYFCFVFYVLGVLFFHMCHFLAICLNIYWILLFCLLACCICPQVSSCCVISFLETRVFPSFLVNLSCALSSLMSLRKIWFIHYPVLCVDVVWVENNAPARIIELCILSRSLNSCSPCLESSQFW